jgi:hypothetical protein
VACQPLAVHGEDFVPRPREYPDGSAEDWKDPRAVPLVVDNGQLPPRCGTCFAYANPFFGNDGTCNLCGGRNPAIARQLAGLPMQFGTVDYEVGGPYITREQGPVQPVQLFALDLTCPNALLYLPILEQVGEDMARHHSRQMPGGPPPRMGICLVSSSGIFFRNHEKTDRYSVMTDVVDEPFAPFPLEEWTYNLSTEQGLAAWRSCLQNELARDMKFLIAQTLRQKNAYGLDGSELSCGGAALAFLADALAETGGRGTWISWRRPNFGAGKLPHRREQREDDWTVYTPLQLMTEFHSKEENAASDFYKSLGEHCAKNRVSLDVLVHTGPFAPQPFLDLATLGEVCRVSCGRLIWIRTQEWQTPFREELTRSLQIFTGWDAVFKVRCSDGLRVKSFLSNGGTLVRANGITDDSPELELSSVSPNTCITVEFEHRVGGIPKDYRFIFFQTALLYSTLSGKRRVRVSTLAIRATASPNEVYKSVDFSTVTTLLLRGAVHRLRTIPPEGERVSIRGKARDMLYHRVVHTLASYRLNTPAMSSPTSQLILPERMQLLPLFCMSLLKSPMLRPVLPRRIDGMQTPVLTPTGDERAFYNFYASQTGPSLTLLMVHPNIFSVVPFQDDVSQWQRSEELEAMGFVKCPAPIHPTIESLNDDGVYLLDDGLRIFLYLGKEVDEEVKRAIIDQEPTADVVRKIDSLSWQMRAFTSVTRGSESELRPTWAPVVLVVQEKEHQGPREHDILTLMVNDVAAGERDYVDFLCTLHRRIREKMEAGSQ